MDEKKKSEEGANQNQSNGNQPQESTLVESTNAAAERLEKANKEERELLDRRELIMAQDRISGRASAGQQPPKEKTDDEKWAEEAKERYAGTGQDPTPDNSPTTYS